MNDISEDPLAEESAAHRTEAAALIVARSNLSWRDYLLAEEPWSRTQARLRQVYLQLRVFGRNPAGVLGLSIVVSLLLLAVLAPFLVPRSPAAQDLALRLAPPSAADWFGTDELGRDIFARILFGARISLGIVAIVAALAVTAGVAIGCSAGYLGGWTDRILMRLTDVFLAFPRLMLALALAAAIRSGTATAVIAIALTAWPPYARVARAETMALRHAEFIEAARLQGASRRRIIFNQIMPLCLSSVLVRLTLDLSGILMAAAALGFLGLGAQPPSPEWGAMIASGRRFILDQWWVAFFPGLAICIASLGFSLLGDGLRDLLDPKQR